MSLEEKDLTFLSAIEAYQIVATFCWNGLNLHKFTTDKESICIHCNNKREDVMNIAQKYDDKCYHIAVEIFSIITHQYEEIKEKEYETLEDLWVAETQYQNPYWDENFGNCKTLLKAFLKIKENGSKPDLNLQERADNYVSYLKTMFIKMNNNNKYVEKNLEKDYKDGDVYKCKICISKIKKMKKINKFKIDYLENEEITMFNYNKYSIEELEDQLSKIKKYKHTHKPKKVIGKEAIEKQEEKEKKQKYIEELYQQILKKIEFNKEHDMITHLRTHHYNETINSLKNSETVNKYIKDIVVDDSITDFKSVKMLILTDVRKRIMDDVYESFSTKGNDNFVEILSEILLKDQQSIQPNNAFKYLYVDKDEDDEKIDELDIMNKQILNWNFEPLNQLQIIHMIQESKYDVKYFKEKKQDDKKKFWDLLQTKTVPDAKYYNITERLLDIKPNPFEFAAKRDEEIMKDADEFFLLVNNINNKNGRLFYKHKTVF